MADDDLIAKYAAQASKSIAVEAEKRIAESTDPEEEARLKGELLVNLVESEDFVPALLARLGPVRAALDGHGGGISVQSYQEVSTNGTAQLDLILDLTGACLSCGAAPGTLDGIKNIFSSPIKAFKSTFAAVMAETSETTEDNAPVKIDLPAGADNSDAIAAVEANRREVVVPANTTVDTSDLMGPVADPFAGMDMPVFNNVSQTGGDTFNTNASVSMGMSSSHTDETARILSESVYN